MGQIIRLSISVCAPRPEDEEAPPKRGSSAQEMRQRLGTRGSCDRAAGERRGRKGRRCQGSAPPVPPAPRSDHSPSSNTPWASSWSLQIPRGAL